MSKAATAEVIDTPAPRPLPPLQQSRFGQPGAFRNEHLVNLPADVPWEAIHSPSYWRLVVHRLRIGDTVEVRTDDLTKWGVYVVNFVEASTGAISLAPLIERDIPEAIFTPDATGAFYPKYLGLADGWAVIRAEDEMVMVRNIRSQQEARSRIATEYSKPAKQSFG